MTGMWRLEALGCALVGSLTGVALAVATVIGQNRRGGNVGATCHDHFMDDMIDRAIGPRRVGGRYRSAYSGQEYEVLAITRASNAAGDWSITVQYDDRARPTTHATTWSPRDQVVWQPLTSIVRS